MILKIKPIRHLKVNDKSRMPKEKKGRCKVLNFDFHIPTRVIFGKDTHREIGALLKLHVKKVLLHYGGSNIKKSGLYDAVVASLKESKIDFIELGGVVPSGKVFDTYAYR